MGNTGAAAPYANVTGNATTDAIAALAHAAGVDHSNTTHALFIRALLMLVLVLVSMNINGVLHKKNFHYLSESAVMIILGVLVAMGWTAISYDENNVDIQLSSNFFYMVLLPPIIFEGGFTLQRVSFFANFVTIFSLAFAGALASTFVCSILMFIFSKAVMPWSLAESLVFGSLISSTDPVTVLSLLPSTVDKRLYMLIFGESALNDAVSIILFRFFTEIADPKMKLGVGPFFLSVFASAGVFIGSFLVGVIIALVFAKITKHVKMPNPHVYEMVMLLVFAYSSYLLADVLQLTGIISIFFCGVAMAHYAAGNLSDESRKTIKTTLRVLAFMCECFIFLYLGMGLLSFHRKTTYDPLMIIFALISILVARCHVFIIIGIKNWIVRDRDDPIPMNQQVLIWFSGLRGAVAFALGVSFLEIPVFAEDVKGMIFGTTVVVIVITIIVFGGLTPYMLVWLGIVKPGEDGHHGDAHQDEMKHIEEGGEKSGAKTYSIGDEEEEGSPTSVATSGKTDLKVNTASPGSGHEKEVDPFADGEDAMEEEQQLEVQRKVVFGWLYHFDAKYIRPHFTNKTVDTFTPKALFPANPPPPEPTEKEVLRSHPGSRKHSTVMSARRLVDMSQKSLGEKKSSTIDMESLVLKSSRGGSNEELVKGAAAMGQKE
ncbi:Sodium/hydrogen exchanger 9 [Phlyctochytrium bullatum]|nr:Sodium/hydrogen exchanger 9 [Phlyctochytrium bullatum]